MTDAEIPDWRTWSMMQNLCHLADALKMEQRLQEIESSTASSDKFTVFERALSLFEDIEECVRRLCLALLARDLSPTKKRRTICTLHALDSHMRQLERSLATVAQYRRKW